MLQLAIILAYFQSFTSSINTEYFSGVIIYKMEYFDSKTNTNITQHVSPMLGSQHYYYTDGKNYKTSIGDSVLIQLYNTETNKILLLNPISKEIGELDAAIAESKIIEITKGEQIENVNGENCSMLRIATDKGESIYYYAPKYLLKKENFKHHNYGHWFQYLESTNGALPLKYTIKDPMFILVATAVHIEFKELSSSDFDRTLFLQH